MNGTKCYNAVHNWIHWINWVQVCRVQKEKEEDKKREREERGKFSIMNQTQHFKQIGYFYVMKDKIR